MEQLSELWCISCGQKGIPIMRNRSQVRAEGHRKKLYCVHCRVTINHIETRNAEEARRFREEFEAGKYAEEAVRSIAFAKEEERRRTLNNERSGSR